MKKDILGREVKDYDLVVAKGTGRYAMPMTVGVWLGQSIVSEDSRRAVRDVFLIEHPAEAELAIKEKVIEKIRVEEEAKKARAAIKPIPLSKMEVGGIYEDVYGHKSVFLGHCCEELHNPNYKNPQFQSGLCFLEFYKELDPCTVQRDLVRMLNDGVRYGRLGFLKGNRKFKNKTGDVELQREYEFEWELGRGWRNKPDVYSAKLTLLDLPEN